MKLNIFIIILNWNGCSMLLNCLKKVIESKTDFDLKVLAVDNNSSDNSVRKLEKLFPSVVLIKNKKNLGWSGGNNIGIKYAIKHYADCLLLLNNDVYLDINAINCLVKELYSKDQIGIVGPKTYFQNDKKRIADAGGIIDKNRFFGKNRGNGKIDKGQYDKEKILDYVSGSAILVKKEVFEKIGFLDEHFFLYYEDADFCQRAKKAGFLSVFVPDSIAYHEFGATGKIGSPLHNYYTTRNHYLFAEKHAPINVKLREFLRTPKTIMEFALSKDENKRKYSLLGIRDYFLRRFGERTYW